jgi:glycosyltransferase involved in cell wall biosynthesis
MESVKESSREKKERMLLLIGNYPGESRSMDRFLSLMKQGVEKESDLWKVLVLRPIAIFGKLGVSGQARKWLAYVDKYVLFPMFLCTWTLWQRRRYRFICHICDHSNAVYRPCVPGVRVVITCHDLIAVKSARGVFQNVRLAWTGRLLQGWIAASLTKADLLVCVSEATREDVRQFLGEALYKKTVVIPNAVDPVFWEIGRKHAKDWKENLGGRYILHVGARVWYKNRSGCLQIYEELMNLIEDPPLLVFAGDRAQDCDLHPYKAFQKGLVRDLGPVSELDLAGLYQSAELLLFPSRCEGFGWPILEAQACGCLVVTTRSAPMTEVGGEAAVYIDPEDVKGSARVLAELLAEDRKRKEERIFRGQKNAQGFSLEGMVKKYLRVYDLLLEGGNVLEKEGLAVCGHG